MRNFFEIIKEDLYFNKFAVGDNIAVEYTCPLEEEDMGLCSQSDYLVHVLSGKKTWRTIHGKWVMRAGQTLYLKKGAAVIRQSFDEDFCMLGFFISDDLIREAVRIVTAQGQLPSAHGSPDFTATELISTPYLEGFFQSMLAYFRSKGRPLDYILTLKLQELLVNIICGPANAPLVAYLKSINQDGRPSLPRIMEANFCYNLKLEDFAKLCHRSLSAFKREFHDHYQTSPGKWLLARRLEHAACLLRNECSSVTQVAFDSGFADTSHFSRAFKQHFGASPSEYRLTAQSTD